MSLPYFLADDPASGVLTGAEAKHAHVKRIEPGEHIMLIDGQGSTAVTRVTSVTPSRVDGVVEKQTRVPQPSPRVTVVQAVPKGDRAELGGAGQQGWAHAPSLGGGPDTSDRTRDNGADPPRAEEPP